MSDQSELPFIQNLHVSDNLISLGSSSPNPWNDNAGSDAGIEPAVSEEHRIHTPDPSTLDPSIASGLGAEESSEADPDFQPPTSEEVLSEFDPLANQEEKNARDAWAETEPRPPPPERTPSPPPKPPLKDISPVSAGSGSTFPSLAALARSFSIPTLSRPRPLSLDTAKAVPSPATLSSFGAQQQSAPVGTSGRSTPVRNETSSTRDDESSTPEDSNSKEDPPFDFQKFLDQMKSRSAEPVAKYLKS